MNELYPLIEAKSFFEEMMELKRLGHKFPPWLSEILTEIYGRLQSEYDYDTLPTFKGTKRELRIPGGK